MTAGAAENAAPDPAVAAGTAGAHTSDPGGPQTAILEALTRLNAFVLETALRDYQRRILETGRFTIGVAGREIAPAGCAQLTWRRDPYRFDLAVIGYRFEAPVPFWVIAGEIGHAYPLRYVSFDGFETTHDLVAGGPAALSADQARTFTRFEPEWAERGVAAPAPRAKVKIGHPNFAHHAWNELAALKQSSAVVDLSDVDLEYSFHPLGAPDFLTLGLRSCGRAPAAATELREGGALFTPIGGLRLDAVTARAVTRRALVTASTAAKALAMQLNAAAGPTIWLTARREGRGCRNQTALYAQTAALLREHGLAASFIIDGFSLPEDFASPDYDPVRPAFLRRAADFTAEARRICDAIEALGFTCASTAELGLMDTIALSTAADFFITHEGTLHHKIGWFNPTPGWVHTGPAVIRPGLARWHAAQADLAVEPALPAADWMQDCGPSRAHPDSQRNKDYAVADIPAFAHALARDILQQFGPASRVTPP